MYLSLDEMTDVCSLHFLLENNNSEHKLISVIMQLLCLEPYLMVYILLLVLMPVNSFQSCRDDVLSSSVETVLSSGLCLAQGHSDSG